MNLTTNDARPRSSCASTSSVMRPLVPTIATSLPGVGTRTTGGASGTTITDRNLVSRLAPAAGRIATAVERSASHSPVNPSRSWVSCSAGNPASSATTPSAVVVTISRTRLPATTMTWTGAVSVSAGRCEYAGGTTCTVTLSMPGARADALASRTEGLVHAPPLLPSVMIAAAPMPTARATASGCAIGTTRVTSSPDTRASACREISSRMPMLIARGASWSSTVVTTRLSSE